MSRMASRTLRTAHTPGILIAIVLALSLLQLSTAPPLWWDEGWTLSVARTWVETGHYGRLLGGVPISPRLAGAPTVILPVALSFRLFGVGAWQGRLPGVIFTVLALCLLYRLAGVLYGRKAGVVVLMLATVTPMAPELNPLLIGKQVLGEMPALCFLLAGYLLLFKGLALDRAAPILGAGAFWGLAVVTKVQVAPFLALSVALVALAWVRQRDWHSLMQPVPALLVAVGCYVAWRWFATTHLAAPGAEGTISGLYGVTAFVPALPARLSALVVTLLCGLPIVASLVYAACHHLNLSERGIERLALWSVAASWFAWYLLLSVGWVRYLFPPAFVSLVFFAGLIVDATDDLDRRTLSVFWKQLLKRKWRSLTHPQRLAAPLLLLTVPFSVVVLAGTHLRADDSLLHLAKYLGESVAQETLIETYESEIMLGVTQLRDRC